MSDILRAEIIEASTKPGSKASGRTYEDIRAMDIFDTGKRDSRPVISLEPDRENGDRFKVRDIAGKNVERDADMRPFRFASRPVNLNGCRKAAARDVGTAGRPQRCRSLFPFPAVFFELGYILIRQHLFCIHGRYDRMP